jgi:hypothetical protein
MNRQLHLCMWAIALACLAGSSIAPNAQSQQEYTNNFKFNIGQSVQPVFEGWSRVPDGSFNMHFGYLNRNYVQEPHVPIGPNNNIQPGGPDRGQPTFFYTRTQRNMFFVNVPKDWGRTRELIWTITANGKTEKAIGWLQAEWEIDPAGGANTGGRTDEEYVKNSPPTIAITAVPTVKLPAAATLSAAVKDDGLPIPRGRGKPAVGQETPPTLQGGTTAPVNVPEVTARTIRETPPGATPPGGQQRPQGLTVSWIVWRGPAEVTFEPRQAQPKDGVTTTTATFKQPGEYVLRGTVNDGNKTAFSTVPVSVTGTAAAR